MTDKKMPQTIQVWLEKTRDDEELYDALRRGAFLNRDLSMSKILKTGARRELEKMGLIKKRKKHDVS